MPTPAGWPTGWPRIPGISIDPAHVETNIAYVDLANTERGRAGGQPEGAVGVLVNGMGNWVRFVTHYGITAEDVDLALDTVDEAMKAVR